MATDHLTRFIFASALLVGGAAALMAAALPAKAQIIPSYEQQAVCAYQARLYGQQFQIIGHRLKTPIFAVAGFFIAGWPGAAVGGVIGANAESPMERRQAAHFEQWCLGMRSDPPRGLR